VGASSAPPRSASGGWRAFFQFVSAIVTRLMFKPPDERTGNIAHADVRTHTVMHIERRTRIG
jgi:hypothetical protein